MPSEALIILIAVGLVAAIVVLKIVLTKLLNKGVDAAVNARIRAKNKSNPPKEESLAARYGNEQTPNDAPKDNDGAE